MPFYKCRLMIILEIWSNKAKSKRVPLNFRQMIKKMLKNKNKQLYKKCKTVLRLLKINYQMLKMQLLLVEPMRQLNLFFL